MPPAPLSMNIPRQEQSHFRSRDHPTKCASEKLRRVISFIPQPPTKERHGMLLSCWWRYRNQRVIPVKDTPARRRGTHGGISLWGPSIRSSSAVKEKQDIRGVIFKEKHNKRIKETNRNMPHGPKLSSALMK